MEVRSNTTDRTYTEVEDLSRNRDTDAAAIRPVSNVAEEEGDEDYDDEDDDVDLDDDVDEVAVSTDDAAVTDLDDADLAADDMDDDLDLDDEDDEEDDDL